MRTAKLLTLLAASAVGLSLLTSCQSAGGGHASADGHGHHGHGRVSGLHPRGHHREADTHYFNPASRGYDRLPPYGSRGNLAVH